MLMVCANCESEQIRAVPFVFENGTSHIDTATVGGFGLIGTARGLGPFAAKTRGTQRSATAQRLAPPVPRLAGRYFLGGLLLLPVLPSFSLSSASFGWIVFVVTAFLFLRGWICMRWNRAVLPQLVATWRASYLCLRCGACGLPKNIAAGIVGDAYDAVRSRPASQLPGR